ncbi:MAG TPA: hypothetical protein VKY74_23010 [Chloroflexia bacterium]|nr:hypothetical protein [Chloroflexia bacterium]
MGLSPIHTVIRQWQDQAIDGTALMRALVAYPQWQVLLSEADLPRPGAFAPGFATLVLGSSAAPPSVIFDGERYERAFSGAQPAGWTDEYLPPGQTLDHWTRLVGVHLYRGFQDPQQFGQVFERQIKESNPRAGTQLLVRDDGQEALLDFLIWVMESQPIWEFNIFRLCPGAEGVIGYQFAYRIYGTPDLQGQSFVTQREHWATVLQATEFPPPGAVDSPAAPRGNPLC